MSTTAYSTLYARIVPFVSRVPAALLEQQVARAAEDFFEESEIWLEDMASFATVVDQAAYPVVSGYSGVRIKRVEKLVLGESGGVCDVGRYAFGGDQVLTFDPAPAVVEGCVLSVIYVPGWSASGVESGLLSRWGGVIAEGATGLIKRDAGHARHPNPWFDPGGAEFYQERFLRGINKARMERMEMRLNNQELRVRMRDWV